MWRGWKANKILSAQIFFTKTQTFRSIKKYFTNFLCEWVEEQTKLYPRRHFWPKRKRWAQWKNIISIFGVNGLKRKQNYVSANIFSQNANVKARAVITRLILFIDHFLFFFHVYSFRPFVPFFSGLENENLDAPHFWIKKNEKKKSNHWSALYDNRNI